MADKIVKIYGDARFLPRHDTLENWQTKNPILLEAEPSYVIDGEDGKKIKFGDGVTPWNDLPYLSSNINNSGDITVDQTYAPTSENAQSGKAVAEAIALTVEIKPSKIDLPFEYNGGNSGEYFAKLISIDKISNTRSYLRFEFGGSTPGVYVNCPKDELVTYGLEIGKFYFIKISGEQISDKTMEIQKFSKISIDQSYNPDSENAQSGKAVAEAVAAIEAEQKRLADAVTKLQVAIALSAETPDSVEVIK